VKLGDSSLPESPVAGGSQTSASAGSAVKITCQKAVALLKERASADPQSPLFKMKTKRISVDKGRLVDSEDSSVGETISQLLSRNGGRAVSATASAGRLQAGYR